MARERKTTDGLKLIDKWFFDGRAEMQALLDEERKNAEIARKIFELREKSGLSQRALAKLAGTQASVICQLEDADYEGHSLTMLRRIAAALGHTVEVSFSPAKKGRVGSGKRRVASASKAGKKAKANEKKAG
ncbi:MAG: transcriptional regulator with XRE-family HTH domain [Hyphomicrobiaceae bacterium]|jgi:transcriptional regulator with XRE-family HTH domain